MLGKKKKFKTIFNYDFNNNNNNINGLKKGKGKKNMRNEDGEGVEGRKGRKKWGGKIYCSIFFLQQQQHR